MPQQSNQAISLADSDNEIDIKPKRLNLNQKENLLKHHEIIQYIMISIKPGIFQMHYQRYTKEMIKIYFYNIRKSFPERIKELRVQK